MRMIFLKELLYRMKFFYFIYVLLQKQLIVKLVRKIKNAPNLGNGNVKLKAFETIQV